MSSISCALMNLLACSIGFLILVTNVESAPQEGEKQNLCKAMEDYQVKEVDLDQMNGKWFGQLISNQYTTIPTPKDNWALIEKNSFTKTDYKHVLKIIIDDKVVILGIKVCPTTGNIVLKDEFNPSSEEMHFVLLDLEVHSFFMIYLCHDLYGPYSILPKFEVFTRSRDLTDSVKDRAKTEAQLIRQTEKMKQVKRLTCGKSQSLQFIRD